MRRARLPLTCLHQHILPLWISSNQARAAVKVKCATRPSNR
jgi:hypothetical protein